MTLIGRHHGKGGRSGLAQHGGTIEQRVAKLMGQRGALEIIAIGYQLGVQADQHNTGKRGVGLGHAERLTTIAIMNAAFEIPVGPNGAAVHDHGSRDLHQPIEVEAWNMSARSNLAAHLVSDTPDLLRLHRARLQAGMVIGIGNLKTHHGLPAVCCR